MTLSVPRDRGGEPWTSVTSHVDEAERKITFNVYQDVEDIIENNKRLQTIPQKSDWGRHVASIPLNIINSWLQQEWDRGNTEIALFGGGFDKMVERKLRDPDWRWLRTDCR